MTTTPRRGGRRPKHGVPMTETLTFRLTPALFDKLDAVARERRMEMRDLIRDLIERGISYPFLNDSERVM